MKIKYGIICLIMLSTNCLLATPSPTADSIKTLNTRLTEQQGQIDRLNSLIQTSNGSIANSISSSQTFFAVFSIITGIVISVFAIILGIWINSMVNKIQLIQKENEKSLNDTINIKSEVQSLSNSINDNITGLYNKLQNEELTQIINILKENPADFDTYYMRLYARPKMPNEYCKPLLEIVKNLSETSLWDGVKLLFNNFSAAQILADDEITQRYCEYARLVNLSFQTKKDIVDCIYSKDETNIRDTYKNILKVFISGVIKLDKPTPIQKYIIEKFGMDYINKYAKVFATDSAIREKISDFLNRTNFSQYNRFDSDERQNRIYGELIGQFTLLETPNITYMIDSLRTDFQKIYEIRQDATV